MYAERPIPIVMLTAFPIAPCRKRLGLRVRVSREAVQGERPRPGLRAVVLTRRAAARRGRREAVAPVVIPSARRRQRLAAAHGTHGGRSAEVHAVDEEARPRVPVEDETPIHLDLAMLSGRGSMCAPSARRDEALSSPARAARPRRARREDAEASTGRGRAPVPRRAADPIVIVSAFTERNPSARSGRRSSATRKLFRENDLPFTIATAQARFGEWRRGARPGGHARGCAAARKAIEWAKGILMEKESLTEEASPGSARRARVRGPYARNRRGGHPEFQLDLLTQFLVNMQDGLRLRSGRPVAGQETLDRVLRHPEPEVVPLGSTRSRASLRRHSIG